MQTKLPPVGKAKPAADPGFQGVAGQPMAEPFQGSAKVAPSDQKFKDSESCSSNDHQDGDHQASQISGVRSIDHVGTSPNPDGNVLESEHQEWRKAEAAKALQMATEAKNRGCGLSMKREQFELFTVFIRLCLTLLAVAFSTIIVVQSVQDWVQLRDVGKTVELSSRCLNVVTEVGRERGLSGGFIASGGEENAKAVKSQRRALDTAINNMQEYISDNSFNSDVVKTIGYVNDSLQNLTWHRDRVDALAVSGEQSLDWYSELNVRLLRIGWRLPASMHPNELANKIIAFVALGTAIENAGIERGTFNTVLGQGFFSGTLYERVVRSMEAQVQQLETFQNFAEEKEIQFYEQKFQGHAVETTKQFQAIALTANNLTNITKTHPELNLDSWWSTRTAAIDLQIEAADYSKSQLTQRTESVIGENSRRFALAIAGTIASIVSAVYLTVGAIVGYKRLLTMLRQRQEFIANLEQAMTEKIQRDLRYGETSPIHSQEHHAQEEEEVTYSDDENSSQNSGQCDEHHNDDFDEEIVRRLEGQLSNLQQTASQGVAWNSETTFGLG